MTKIETNGNKFFKPRGNLTRDNNNNSNNNNNNNNNNNSLNLRMWDLPYLKGGI